MNDFISYNSNHKIHLFKSHKNEKRKLLQKKML